MSYHSSDPRVNPILQIVKELIADKETNEVILMSISKFFGSQTTPDFSPLINDRHFLYQLFFQFFGECLQKELTSGKLMVIERQLSQRSKVMSKFVFNYREFQLSLLLILADIKLALGLSDGLFDDIIKILHSNGVVSDDGFNHWFQCKKDFDQRLKTVQKCLRLLEWSQEAREDYFFETNAMISVS